MGHYRPEGCESIASILLNGHVVKLSPKYLFISIDNLDQRGSIFAEMDVEVPGCSRCEGQMTVEFSVPIGISVS